MNKLNKFLFALFACVLLTVQSPADNVVVTWTVPNTASNILSVPSITDELVITALTTTVGTTIVKFYDSATTSTNLTQSAYVSYATFATNYSVIITNESDIVITNTFSGLFTGPTSNAAATRSLVPLFTAVVVNGAQRTYSFKLQTLRGLTASANGTAIVEVTYHPNP